MKETVLFRAALGVVLLVGVLIVVYALAGGPHLPRDTARVPTVPAGDEPPPARR